MDIFGIEYINVDKHNNQKPFRMPVFVFVFAFLLAYISGNSCIQNASGDGVHDSLNASGDCVHDSLNASGDGVHDSLNASGDGVYDSQNASGDGVYDREIPECIRRWCL